MKTVALFIFTVVLAAPAWAADVYVDLTLTVNCPLGDYNKSVRDCSGSDGKAYTTFASAVPQLVAGDTLYMRGGTYNQQIELQSKTGTANAWITIAGYPGETVILRYTDPTVKSFGAIRAWGNRGYFIFQDFEIDGINLGTDSGWSIRDGNHHFIVRRVKIYNQWYHGIFMHAATDILVEDSEFHDMRSDCVSGNRHHGFYLHDGGTVTIRRNHIYNSPGGGIQLYPGPWNTNGAKLHDNYIHHTNICATSNTGGIVVGSDDLGPTGSINGAEVIGNIVAHTNRHTNGTMVGIAAGIRVYNNSVANTVSGTKVHNNIIYKTYNTTTSTNNEYCLLLGTGGVNTDVRNNVITDCGGGSGATTAYIDLGSGTTASHNACLSTENCPATNKVTISSVTAVLVDPANGDFRLKQGLNVLRNAGTSVSTRPAPVGVTDIGTYEQGVVTSASMVGDYLELVTSVMTPGVLPVSAITGITVTCGGASPCVGSPTVVSANIKPGSSNVIQVALSGIGVPGTGTVSMGATNATDSLKVGGPTGNAQGLNSLSALSITGTLANTGGVVPPAATWSHFLLDEGSGTVANDATGNGHHGTVSTDVTWVSDESGTGVRIPTDATFRHIASTFGNGINPSTQGFAICVYAKPTLNGNTQKVLFASSGNGTNQRWYAGWTTVNGQPQWGIGIQGSGFTTGSEFVATENLTLVCLVNDSAADMATLWVNGVMGNVVGKSVKSFTSYTLVGNLRVGNDGTFSVNNGGVTVYDVWVWNAMPPLSDIVDLYASLSPVGTSVGLSQSQVQWEHVYTNAALTPQVINPRGDFSTDVVVNGGIALRVQYDCTGGACANIAPRLYYSTNGVDFNLPVPQTLGVDNIAMWGSTADLYFNGGVSSGCVDGFGLTENSGVTIADSVAGQTFALSDTHCRSDRYVVRVGNVPGATFWFRVKTDAGQSFAAYPQAIKLTVIPLQAEIGF